MIIDNMTDEEIFNFYDENWQDYNVVMDLLHSILDNHKNELSFAKKPSKIDVVDNIKEVKDLKKMLLICQDKLDEETHK